MRSSRALVLTSPAPDGAVDARGAGSTVAGRALQAAWVGEIAYALWLGIAGPDHPEPAPIWQLPLFALGVATLAVTGGLLRRRRWALQASAVLALPLVALAIWCFAVDAGGHWVGEAVFAAVVVGTSLHPASWRMHVR